MLAKRIIPCLDVKEGRVVKGVNFVDLKDAGDPVALAAFYDKEGADELVFLDITASSDKRYIMFEVVKKVAETIYIPFTVGGGINDLETIREIIANGADKVSINTAAVRDPSLITRGAEKFGSQCVVVAIDAKRKGDKVNRGSGEWEVFTHGGRTATGMDAVAWAKKAEQLGAGEILLTSMDRDGTKIGYDIELTRSIKEAVKIPVIASGGAGALEHIYEAFVDGKADAALLASLLHYRELTIREIKDHLGTKGITVRR
ncbi:imidazole glycerol phosphate synthase subunit HisF [candidate division WOR-1 bacterium RIFOXYA12_FULL_52_29]|uniref:Imidazole glycerol phosphate synthase subunit HisF n=1 Tax=candidate division WOR-1 bacterium RIFOXYC12_FULL_54_18 TaxID=1802584 RepID=A0A1F4T517_UNCSA|nr:MAG: imidazole glycerol phosphate synthase subunit HisF [candidate division WOR-1 bacterium RIFOXYA2_FULL_51_19]OGC17223.1 MAG: imidazole glycerol phosphate synthase subunit HisF [candidate division WOR-1 bacterium RIFOXYA12_FULL_52_29]OGC26083.1 MAG: imidazole glycerol phosphate synthase subunit HisF [candidate division WOR-1 bacterium RIFOXYB2_FULL_45_9]OGC27640.1 MAG: imidazole glycerol phosphate synthase subunit HisF [candidate division WOR-1 bacterium RIFOXYC12_FULL_54_18]OGC29146.1 MAG